MKTLRPLVREARILWYGWARAELQRTNPHHADLPYVVTRLRDLKAERGAVCFAADTNEGRYSPDSFAATRRALGLPAIPDPAEERYVRKVELGMLAIVAACMVLAGLLR